MLIGKMAETTGVSARMLRYYEKLGLIEPGSRTASGYRQYSDSDVERVFHIEGLRGLGLSLSEVKSALEDPVHDIGTVIDELVVESRRRLREEKRLYDQLVAVRQSEVPDWRAALDVMGLLKNLRSQDPGARQVSALRLRPTAHPRMVARSAVSENNVNVAGALSWSVLQAGDAALEEVARVLNAKSADDTEDTEDTEDAEVRLRAVRILAEAEGTKAHLVVALDDPEPEIRVIAALALGERGGQKSFDELIRMILDGDHDVHASEVLANEESFHEEALEVIEALLRDKDTEFEQRVRLVQALAESEESSRLLLELVDDPTPAVALTAQTIVRTRGSMP